MPTGFSLQLDRAIGLTADYPHLFIVKLIGSQDILGVCVGLDEDEAKEEIADRTGWTVDGVTVKDEGSVSEVPIYVTVIDETLRRSRVNPWWDNQIKSGECIREVPHADTKPKSNPSAKPAP